MVDIVRLSEDAPSANIFYFQRELHMGSIMGFSNDLALSINFSKERDILFIQGRSFIHFCRSRLGQCFIKFLTESAITSIEMLDINVAVILRESIVSMSDG